VDTTYSVKIDEELKDRITNAIKSSGVTGKEFFSKLLEIYESQNAFEGHIKELAELEGHLSRIKGIFSAILENNKLEIETLRSDFEKRLGEKDNAIESLKVKIEELENENLKLKNSKEEMEKDLNTLKKALKDLGEKTSTNIELVKEYKEKIKKLESELLSYENIKEENEKFKSQLLALTSQLESAEKEKKMLEEKIESLNDEIKRINTEHQKEIENVNLRYKMEHQTEIMKEKQECQERVRLIMDDQRKQFEEYNSTIKKLYAQIDEMRETILSLKLKEKEERGDKN